LDVYRKKEERERSRKHGKKEKVSKEEQKPQESSGTIGKLFLRPWLDYAAPVLFQIRASCNQISLKCPFHGHDNLFSRIFSMKHCIFLGNGLLVMAPFGHDSSLDNVLGLGDEALARRNAFVVCIGEAVSLAIDAQIHI
jgi:hypothetical protein